MTVPGKRAGHQPIYLISIFGTNPQSNTAILARFVKRSYFIINIHDHLTSGTIRYLNTVFSFLLITLFVSGKKRIWKAVLLHDLFPRGIQCSLVKPTGSFWVVRPSEQQMYQPGLVQPRLDFCMGHFLFHSDSFLCGEKWQIWQCHPFFPPIFNELTKRPESTYCFRKEIQSAIFIHHTTKTNNNNKKKNPSCLHGINIEYEDKGDMMQCCFYNWFSSTVHRGLQKSNNR